ncbi:SAM-dependent methyltransferase [Actinopolyspora saharensis]|uniref:SAM-dependent methyltransferase n=1 Tax=Actinopolyspora saharensis TaxID=995062 RepID=UPI003F67F6CC
MSGPSWVPAGVDVEVPSAARLYDYYLGGNYNFPADRQLARRIYEVFPQMPHLARVNRAFLRRSVRYLASCGIRQFVDLGCGLPTAGPVHEVARDIEPDSRVVYVDNEPVAVAHSRLLLREVEGTAVLQADLTDPAAVLDSPVTRELLDLEQPVAVLMVAVLHFVSDRQDPAGILQGYRRRLTSGGYLVLSHVSGDTLPDVEQAAELYRNSQNPAYLRTRGEIAGMLSGFELVEPGLVFVPEWRPEVPEEAEDAASCSFYGAVGRPLPS